MKAAARRQFDPDRTAMVRLTSGREGQIPRAAPRSFVHKGDGGRLVHGIFLQLQMICNKRLAWNEP